MTPAGSHQDWKPSHNPWAVALTVMAQPLSILMVAYAQSKFRRPYMTPMVLAVGLFQLLYLAGVPQPTGSSLGLLTLLGQGVRGDPRWLRRRGAGHRLPAGCPVGQAMRQLGEVIGVLAVFGERPHRVAAGAHCG